MSASIATSNDPAKVSRTAQLARRFWTQRYLFLMLMPGIVWFAVFCYYPMYGVTLAFRQYQLGGSLMGSPWIGLAHFRSFFQSFDFWPVMRNTLAISFLKLLLCFPAGVIFALLLNEVTQQKLKRTIQTISYLPHFLSWVVVASMAGQMMSSQGGAINALLMAMRIIDKPIMFMGKPEYFWWITVFTENWKEVGWSAIIYLAAIAGVDPQLYEAAAVDGVGKFKQVRYITLPCISSTILVMFILALAGVMNSNFEQLWLLRNSAVLSRAEVIDTHVFKVGIQLARYDYAAAVGLFKSVIGLIMLFIANLGARHINDTSLF